MKCVKETLSIAENLSDPLEPDILGKFKRRIINHLFTFY